MYVSLDTSSSLYVCGISSTSPNYVSSMPTNETQPSPQPQATPLKLPLAADLQQQGSGRQLPPQEDTMADGSSSSNVASVAIVLIVVLAAFFAYFLFIRGGDGKDIDIDVKLPGKVGTLTSPRPPSLPLVAALH